MVDWRNTGIGEAECQGGHGLGAARNDEGVHLQQARRPEEDLVHHAIPPRW